MRIYGDLQFDESRNEEKRRGNLADNWKKTRTIDSLILEMKNKHLVTQQKTILYQYIYIRKKFHAIIKYSFMKNT